MKRSYSQIKLYEPVLAVTRGRLMRGRLSWLLLAAALQGSASTRSPERRELDVVVASIDYVSMRFCSVQV